MLVGLLLMEVADPRILRHSTMGIVVLAFVRQNVGPPGSLQSVVLSAGVMPKHVMCVYVLASYFLKTV